jgi:anaerobic magnesium-protoporphyrin IX monomethyl ester cyclase
MKALLINPHKLIPVSFSLTQRASPPLGLAYIAGVLEEEQYEVSVIDCVAEAPSNYFPFQDIKDVSGLGIDFDSFFNMTGDSYDIIGVSTMFSNNWLINRHLINLLKKKYPSALIVVGGEHATAIPEYCLKDCEGLDMVATGEGEETIAEIAQLLKEKKPLNNISGTVFKNRDSDEIVTAPRRKRIREIDAISRPAWHYFPLNKYFENEISYGIAYGKSLPIFATRGCPYECTFCSSPQMWGMKYNMREVSDVIDEIKFLNKQYGVTNIDFYDLTAIINKRWIIEFCRQLKQNNLIITWQIPAGTRSESIDYEVASALKEGGCKNITYAPESGSQEMLNAIKKKVTPKKMLFSISESYKAGLDIKLNIMMGYPDEKLNDIFRTIWFLIRASYHGATDASPSMFSPYPGSALFNELVTRNELALSDQYFEGIVFSQSLHTFKNYNRNNNRTTMVIMLMLAYLAFYVSNYLFRPIRAFRLVMNVATNNYQTRGEYMLGEVLKRKKAIKVT